MEQTRAALSEKLEMLEEKVQETVEDATATVGEAIDTVGDTIGRIKQTLNVRYQMEHHPWAALGTALLAGFAAGSLARRRVPAARPRIESSTPLSVRSGEPSVLTQAAGTTGSFLRELGVVEILREMAREVLPKFIPKIEQAFGLTPNGGREREHGTSPRAAVGTDRARSVS
jgi:hypothetical protein